MKAGIKPIIAGGILFITAVFAIPLIIVILFVSGRPDETQFIVPGHAEVVVEEPGRYYLWHDYRTVYEGKSYNHPEGIPSGFEFDIMDAHSGESFKFHEDLSVSSTDTHGAKKSIGYVNVQGPAAVMIDVTGPNEPRIFSFCEFDFMSVFTFIFGGVIIALILGFTSIGLIIWGVFKLIRSSKNTV